MGECWDGTTTIKNWINGTKVDGKPTSAAFDFQFRYRVRDAVNAKNWTKLTASSEQAAGKPLVFDQNFKRYAVTFVENHDTERRSNSEQDPLKADTLAANAFMMAMPGTPCVFFKHWIAAKGDIKRMIAARKLVGIHNQSEYEQKASNTQYYAVQTTGTQGQLICVVGSNPKGFAKPDGFTQIIERNDFIYYVSDNLASQWTEIENRIAEEQKAQEEVFIPHTATIYVRDELGWTRMNYYIWDSNNNSQLNGGWPGKQITDKKTVNGYEWYYQTFNIDEAGYYVNVVFSTNSGSPQTVDVSEIKDDKFYVIKRDMMGSKYLVEEDTETSAISMVEDDGFNMDNASYYSLDGRMVSRPVKGIYIIRSGNKAKTILIK